MHDMRSDQLGTTVGPRHGHDHVNEDEPHERASERLDFIPSYFCLRHGLLGTLTIERNEIRRCNGRG